MMMEITTAQPLQFKGFFFFPLLKRNSPLESREERRGGKGRRRGEGAGSHLRGLKLLWERLGSSGSSLAAGTALGSEHTAYPGLKEGPPTPTMGLHGGGSRAGVHLLCAWSHPDPSPRKPGGTRGPSARVPPARTPQATLVGAGCTLGFARPLPAGTHPRPCHHSTADTHPEHMGEGR